MKKFKRIIFGIGVVTLVVLAILNFTGMSIEVNVFLGILCILWGIDNMLSWHIGDKMAIALGIDIPEDASEILRFLGLCYAMFLVVFGALALAERLPL